MCEPISISLAITAITIAASTAATVQAQKAKVAQKRLAKRNARLQRSQIQRTLQKETEASAEKLLELSRAHVAQKGAVASQDFGGRSLRAIGRSIGFEVGRDGAIIDANQEQANVIAASQIEGVDLTLQGQMLSIGDTSKLGFGLKLAGNVVQGIGAGASAGAAFSGGGAAAGGAGGVGGTIGATASGSPGGLTIGSGFTSSALAGRAVS